MIATRRLTVRRGPLSLRLDVRVLVLAGLLGAALVVALLVSLGRGEASIAPADVVRSLLGSGRPADTFVVVELRLPRVLVGALVGVALGLAGAIFQGMARNPLVSPDVIGISSGASLAAVSLIVFGNADGALAVPAVALAGALLAGVALYALAWRSGLHAYRLVLVGIGVAALLDAGISYALAHGRIFEVQQAVVWLIGSLNGRAWRHVWPLAATLAVLVPLVVVLARRLAALELGDDMARSLGLRVEGARAGLLAAAIALTAVAVASSGPIAFVAFIAPHLARRLGRTVAAPAVLVLAGLCGALLVVTADLVGRLALSPTELPVGIVTALVAAPYFLMLLRRAARSGMA